MIEQIEHAVDYFSFSKAIEVAAQLFTQLAIPHKS